MGKHMFEGTYTALVTPMRDDDARTVDVDALQRLVEQQLDGGVDGLVPCGTTGEAATLSYDEWATVVSAVKEAAAGRAPIIAGTGSNSTADTIARTRAARELGVDAALVVVPYYNKPTQAGLIGHFEAVMNSVDLPVVLYNVPGRTATNMLPATVASLAAHSNAVAVKEASGSLGQVQEIIDRTDGALAVLSGDDGLCVPMYSVGGAGVISVVSNPAPGRTAALDRDYKRGDTAAAAAGQIALRAFIDTLFCEANPQPVKMAMHLLGLMAPVTRMPLCTATDATRARLTGDMQRLGLL